MNYYKTDSKGKLRVLIVEANGAALRTWTGIVGGALKESTKVYTGNSRFTGTQQAATAYKLKCKNSLKKGYSLDPDAKPKFIPKPMLVGRWDKLKKKPEFPLIVQPKLDGVRALLKDGKFTTRSMEPLDVPHITYNSGEYLDGELYCHDMKLQDIIGCTRKANGDTKRISFVVFDKPGTDDYIDRFESLEQELSHVNGRITNVPWAIVNTEDELNYYYKEKLSEGYEGIVIKTLDNQYEWNKRSKSIWKMKPTFTDEFTVIRYGFEDRVGVGKLIEFYCWTKDGLEFKVIPAWSTAERAKAYTEAGSYIGQRLTVEYRGLTKAGIPQHAVGIAFRGGT